MDREEVIGRTARFDVSKEMAYLSRFGSEPAGSLPGPYTWLL